MLHDGCCQVRASAGHARWADDVVDGASAEKDGCVHAALQNRSPLLCSCTAVRVLANQGRRHDQSGRAMPARIG